MSYPMDECGFVNIGLVFGKVPSTPFDLLVTVDPVSQVFFFGGGGGDGRGVERLCSGGTINVYGW